MFKRITDWLCSDETRTPCCVPSEALPTTQEFEITEESVARCQARHALERVTPLILRLRHTQDPEVLQTGIDHIERALQEALCYLDGAGLV